MIFTVKNYNNEWWAFKRDGDPYGPVLFLQGRVGFAGYQFKEQPHPHTWHMSLHKFYENGNIWDYTNNATAKPATPCKIRLLDSEREI